MTLSLVARTAALSALVSILVATAGCGKSASTPASAAAQSTSSAEITVAKGAFVRVVRVAGITEAVRATTATAPRMAGQSSPTMIITKLIKSGSRVAKGAVLVEFDPQDQIRVAFDRRTEFQDLEQQIRRVQAEQAAAYAADETAMTQADNDVARAQLEVRKNRVLPPVDAEKNTLLLEEAQARASDVREARRLRRLTADADLKILQIRRERMERALNHAEQNASFMVIRAPFDGLAVTQAVFKGSAMTEIQEGDEVRAGMPIVQVVDPSAMQVRVRISQADGSLVSVGQRTRVTLDAYPGLAFDGVVRQVAPLAITSSVTPPVRSFVALVAIAGADPNLMPDLSAAVDIHVEQRDHVTVLPREAVVVDAKGAWVRVKEGRSFVRRAVTVGALSDIQAVIVSGLEDGSIVARRAAGAE